MATDTSVRLKWTETRRDRILSSSSGLNRRRRSRVNRRSRQVDSTWSIWLVLKGKRRPRLQAVVRKKVFTSTCRFQRWVRLSVRWPVPIRVIFLTETPNLPGCFNNRSVVMRRPSWSPTSVLLITTTNKPSVPCVMLLKPRESRTSQRSTRIQRTLWSVSIRRKSKDWRNNCKASYHLRESLSKREWRFLQRGKSNSRTDSMTRRTRWRNNLTENRTKPTSLNNRPRRSTRRSKTKEKSSKNWPSS